MPELAPGVVVGILVAMAIVGLIVLVVVGILILLVLKVFRDLANLGG